MIAIRGKEVPGHHPLGDRTAPFEIAVASFPVVGDRKYNLGFSAVPSNMKIGEILSVVVQADRQFDVMLGLRRLRDYTNSGRRSYAARVL